jgi:hypothetical protein
MVPGTAGHVLCYVRVNEPGAAGLEIDIGISDIRFSFAQSLYFRAVEDQTGFKSIQQMEIIGGRAVLSHDLLTGFAVLLGFFRWLGHNPP